MELKEAPQIKEGIIKKRGDRYEELGFKENTIKYIIRIFKLKRNEIINKHNTNRKP